MDTHTRKLILFLFFLSGACGLIYEVLWVRMLGLIFGNTTYAVSTVLAAYMAGLALGSWYFGHLIDRVTKRQSDIEARSLGQQGTMSPLRLFAFLMTGIGIYCIFTPVLFGIIRKIYILFGATQITTGSILLVFLLGFIVILVPTTLMGGTLPVLSRYFTSIKHQVSNIGHSVGILYSVNTWGAVLGAFATGYILIMLLGVKGTLYVASAINLLIAGTVFLFILKKSLRTSQSETWQSPKNEIASASPRNDRLGKIVLLAICLSGFTALSYEVVWTRVLSMVLGSSVYAFATMLCAFLAGIALGSWIYARLSLRARRAWQSRKNEIATVSPRNDISSSISLFGFLQAGIGISVLVLIPIFGILPFVFLKLFKVFGQNFAGFQFFQFLLAFGVMLIPTTLFGATIPLACKIYSGSSLLLRGGAKAATKQSHEIASATPRNDTIGASVGNVYAANTIGAIIGSILAGFCLIPLIGLQKTITIVAMINVGLAILLINFVPGVVVARSGATKQSLMERRWARGLVTCFLLFFSIPYAIALPQWNKNILASGVYQYAPDFLSEYYIPGKSLSKQFKDFKEKKEILYYKEGRNFTVSVDKDKIRGQRTLRIDGKADASSNLYKDMITQVLSGHLPLLLYSAKTAKESQRPQKVLIVGLASGVTLGAVTLHKEIENIDCVEIEPVMIKACHYFDKFNHKPLEDKRVNLIINDARNYLLTTDKKYDIIISEPSNPWMSGQSNLFTREFFQLVEKHLKKDGIFCQWLQIYRLTPKMYKMVLKTFQLVFPHTSIWETAFGDTLLIATSKPLKIDCKKLVKCMEDEKIKKDLQRIHIKSPLTLMVRMVLSEDKIRELSKNAKFHTDNFPRLEYGSGKSFYSPKLGVEVAKILKSNIENISPYLENFSDYEKLIKIYLNKKLYYCALSELKLHSSEIKSEKRHNLSGRAYMGLGNIKKAEEEFKKALKIEPEFYSAWINLSRIYREKGDYEQAEKIINFLIKENAPLVHSEKGYLYLAQNKPEHAMKEFEKAISLSPQDIDNYLLLGMIYTDYLKIPPGAIIVLDKAKKLFPDSPEVYYLLGKAFLMMRNDKKAQDMFGNCILVDERYREKIVQLSEGYGK